MEALGSVLEVDLISLCFLSFVFYLDFEIFPGIKHFWYCLCLKIVYKVTFLVVHEANCIVFFKKLRIKRDKKGYKF